MSPKATTATDHGPTWLLILATAVNLLLLAGCQVGLESACSGDSDCPISEVCVRGTCAETCASDADCTRPQTTCQPFFGNSGEAQNVCRIDSPDAGVGSDAAFQCSNDSQCQQRLGERRAECGLGRRCILPPRKNYSVLLRDTTPDNQGALDGAPGADIAAAYVADGSDRPADAYGWARALVYRPADNVDQSSHLNGHPPDLDESRRCVAGSFEETTSPLGGAGGLMLMKFVDDGGTPVEIDGDSRVVVIEWGSNCDSAADPLDEYEAFLCVSDSETISPERDCNHRLGTGSGYKVFRPDLE